jgi:excisionase family DNA binding protein
VNEAEVRGDWLTPAEAARSLKISVGTIYELLAANRLPGPIRIGRQWRISRQALEAAVRPWGSSVD